MLPPDKAVRRLIHHFEEVGPAYEEMETIPVREVATVRALVEGLSSPEFRARLACAHALGRATVEEDVAAEAVAPLLVDEEELVQAAAGKALGQLASRTEAAVAPLQRALASAERDVVRDTLQGLQAGGGSASPEVTAQVRALARGEGPLRPHDERWGPELERDVAREACRVLSLFPGEATREALERALDRNEDLDWQVREAALDSLLKLDPSVRQSLGAILNMVRRRSRAADAHSAAHEVSALVQRLDPTRVDASAVVKALARWPLPSHAWNDPAPLLRDFMRQPTLSAEALAEVGAGLEDKSASVRATCVALLGWAGAKARPWRNDLLTRLDAGEPRLRAAAAEALGRLGDASPSVLSALKKHAQAHAQAEEGRAAREALERLDTPAPLPEGGTDTEAVIRAYLPHALSVEVRGLTVLREDTWYFAWKQVHQPTPEDAWSTDGEQVGLGALHLPTQHLETSALPCPLPARPTGAAGAKRRFSLEAMVGEELVCLLERPFMDSEGWGTRNFLFSFKPDSGAWFQFRPSRRGGRPAPLRPPVDEQAEAPERTISGGELLVWTEDGRELALHSDYTPYHLDDYEVAPQVQDAQARRRCAQESQEAGHTLQVDVSASEPWLLQSPGAEGVAPVKLYGLKRAVLARDTRVQRDELLALHCRRAIHARAEGRRYVVLALELSRRKKPSLPALVVLELPP
ncbi:HEAT repeat domain-containing protein [Hyalangium rubrum]|uniref:HEAT repeat domain-containing protein n=1 Tax=Hyalangium rubrum TaxID=3103134 RepID=A0ABU5HG12_9BACT|nr:HEAT repeat domain-containing protein [Hyalangium sp. s54d21]MDY7232186.1 HEAT repeat domain-containing protein [Hyalangium sp. s54d21]